MTSSMYRKRRLLWADDEFCLDSGLTPEQLASLEENFFTPEQKKYLLAVRYRVMVIPDKQRKMSEDERNRKLARDKDRYWAKQREENGKAS